MKKGLLLSFEGCEGAGKTVVINEIYSWVLSMGYNCIKTREPGGINISEQIREVILNKDNTSMDGRTEALLYAAARRQHLVEKVIPALEEGKIVLCDRFIDSSLAYQGYARELGIEDVMSINKFAINEYMPDITILLDIEPKIGLERININKDREINRLDLEKLDFHQKVREGYNLLYKHNKERIIKVNANQNKNNVIEDVKNILISKLQKFESSKHN